MENEYRINGMTVYEYVDMRLKEQAPTYIAIGFFFGALFSTIVILVLENAAKYLI